jgi:GDPmannose 4,6-dehydratase
MDNNKKLIAFITGITGQDGSYLAELLLEKGYIVYGMIRRSSSINTARIDHLYEYDSKKFVLRYGDLCDPTSMTNIVNEIVMTHSNLDRLEIYNLGAMSHVKISFDMPEYCGNADGLGVLRLLENIRQQPQAIRDKIRFYQASTSELFGDVLEIPQKETTPFNPQSPYATAKMYGHYIVKNYRESYGLYVCSGILFNHESPRRGHNFVTRKITMAIKQITKDPNYVLKLGNIYAKRDWGHAKDYVKGMWLMLQQEKPDDYVLATGEQYSVKEFVDRAFWFRNIFIRWEGEGVLEKGYCSETGRLLVAIDPRYYRPNEVETLLGDATKAKTNLGWTPETTFDELVREMVELDCQ